MICKDNKIRFYHARIAAMGPNWEIFTGELHVEGNRITYVGDAENAPQKMWDREIDVENDLLLPGFKNAHTHTAMTFLRSYADDVPLQTWLYEKIFPMEDKLTKEDQYWLIRLGIMEYLTSGITANFDMYRDFDCHAEVSCDVGFRTVMCSGLNDFCSSVEEVKEQFYRLNEMSPLVSCQLGFHAEYTTKRETLEQLAKVALDLRKPVYTHIAETKKEVEECYEKYHVSPFGFLDSIGMFAHGGGGFHGVWMSEADKKICQKNKLAIVSNPSSNLKLASGIADLCGLMDAGIPVALGTDGPASNNALDMFREMYLASVLPKVYHKDAAAMKADDVLSMATTQGALVMGLKDCDCLAEGKLADIIRIDMKRPNMQPEHDILKNLVYSGSKENVRMTMIDGKILYEDGQFFMDEDPLDVYRQTAKIIERMEA